MINILINFKTFKIYLHPVSGNKIINDYFNNKKKNILLIKVNNSIKKTSVIISKSTCIEFISQKDNNYIHIIKHDITYILAHAIKMLHPKSQITTGQIIQKYFYYDFDNLNVNNHKFIKIENQMQKIVKMNLKITSVTISKTKAINIFKNCDEFYKLNTLTNIPKSKKVIIRKQGNFFDICQKFHGPSTNYIKIFKLTKISGAYWTNNANYTMLLRIYGKTFANIQHFKIYLSLINEAKKRDHRKIGKKMDLFHFHKNAQGSVFWNPKGWKTFLILLHYLRKKQNSCNYKEINTPEIMDRELWQTSGHWDKFSNNIYKSKTIEKNKEYAVRPMNCPGAIIIYKSALKSYRDLPLKLAEFGKVYRFESSGALYGLLRGRSFTQDDAHIFCTKNQLAMECKKICQLLLSIYNDFGFNKVKIKFSNRPKNRLGTNKIWDNAEYSLLESLKQQNLPYTINEEGGSFYGPKLEFILTDSLEREWQLGTIQVDFNLPSRFDINYIDKKGIKKRPVMIHRALFGSIERFYGILLEHYNGKLPLWIAPIQVAILLINDIFFHYSQKINQLLLKKNIRCILDTNNHKISSKIKKYSILKIPYLLIVGQKEYKNKIVTIKKIGKKKQETLVLNDFIDKLLYQVTKKEVIYNKKIYKSL